MPDHADPLALSRFRDERTCQVTTFDQPSRNKVIQVPRGTRATICQASGQGYVAQLWLTFPGWFWQHWETSAPVSQNILKTLILRMYWDDQAEPAVQVPIGDFFGNGLCEISNFTARSIGMPSGGFSCSFPMPFKTGFRIELENLDEHIDTYVFMNVLYQLTPQPPKDVGYFHAHFRTGRHAGPDPVEMAQVEGRGHLAGCTLSMQGQQPRYLSFLEAPEQISLDDDWETPRIQGTGLEDFFLGGWYFREGVFTGPLNGVTSKDTLSSSIAMYRLFEADAIRFERRFRFRFVNPWAPERLSPYAYSACTFLYLEAPGGCAPAIPSRPELLCWYRVRDTDRLSVP